MQLHLRSIWKRALTFAVLAILAASAVWSLADGLLAPSAKAESLGLVFEVDTDADGADTDTSDKKCLTTAGKCTLRAAIQQANAIPADTDVMVAVASGFKGKVKLPNRSADLMVPTVSPPVTVSQRDNGAYLHIKRKMIVDLDNRLGLGASSDLNYGDFWVAGVFVDAANVQLKNFSDFFSTDSSIVFSPKSSGSSLIGGKDIQTTNSHGSRFVVVNGASDITLEGLVIGRLTNDSTDPAKDLQNGAIVVGLDSRSGAAVDNLTIHDVVIDNAPAVPGESVCNFASGTAVGGEGCASNGIMVVGTGQAHGWEIDNVKFRNFPSGTFAADFRNAAADGSGSPNVNDWVIKDCWFEGIETGTGFRNAALQLPAKAVGTILVTKNKFANSADQVNIQGTAISFEGPDESVSNVKILANSFDGFQATGDATIYLKRNARTVTVRFNEFGENTNATPATEPTASANVMVANAGSSTNNRVRVWKPTATALVDGRLQITATIPAFYSGSSMAMGFYGEEADIDVFATDTGHAEEFLASAREKVPPVQQSKDQEVSFLIDAPITARGWIRLQMHSDPDNGTGQGKAESSQYSELVRLPPLEDRIPKMAVDLRAWKDVPSQAQGDYSATVALSPADHELTDSPLPARVSSTTPIWFTYSVENTGLVLLRDVEVGDSDKSDICTIPTIAPGTTAGCVRGPQTLPSG
ncbi:MAG: hypothetical protein LBS27_07955 [Bifidobacteriaceae bacterium]|nr:hypothetical protein [Bifidobacteriaceae bacterium]